MNCLLPLTMDPIEALLQDTRSALQAWTRPWGTLVEDSSTGVLTSADEAAQREELRREETLIAAGVPDDSSRFALLYERYYPRILNYLYRRTMNRELAEDLTSRTFLQAFDSLRSRRQEVWVCPWLYRIATNVHVSHMRSLGALRERLAEMGRHWMSFLSHERRPDTQMSDKEQSALVRTCLMSLPEKYRGVLLLRYDEELSYEEIGHVLGRPAPTVRKQLERGLQMLEASYRLAQETGGRP